ncbi:hypothetical protein K402DRAFT_458135 [Aulographum hederae CBS 113979]|uniref:Uncharacterized protein n=1 Tax=Aulographum hederae CBS 113979 TaxID=1176131 RepID=A0A6G1GK99_9PEZI|nr:hypothetical protein K402DRAFT_458135 [Aulographum hederae CBS 113979]
MPMNWGPEADARILLGMLSLQNNTLSKDQKDHVAKYVGPDCTVYALEGRLKALKKMVHSSPVGKAPAGLALGTGTVPSKNPNIGTPGSARKKAAPSTPVKSAPRETASAKNSSAAKRKYASDEEEEEDGGEVQATPASRSHLRRANSKAPKYEEPEPFEEEDEEEEEEEEVIPEPRKASEPPKAEKNEFDDGGFVDDPDEDLFAGMGAFDYEV